MQRTIRLQNGDYNNNKIYSFMTSISKEIFNSYIFCTKFYDSFKHSTYKNTYEHIYSSNINSFEQANKFIAETFARKLDTYSNDFKNIKINNDVAYKIINKFLEDENKDINNSTYFEIYNELINLPELNSKLIWNEQNKSYMFTKIISNILEKKYSGKYFFVAKQIKNNIPVKEENLSIIDDVKNDAYLFKNKYDDIFNFKQWVSDMLFFRTCNKNMFDKIAIDYFTFENIYNNIKNRYLNFIEVYKKLNINKDTIELTIMDLYQSINKLKTINEFYTFNSKHITKLLEMIRGLQKDFDIKKSDYCCKQIIGILKLLNKEIECFNEKNDGLNFEYILNAREICKLVNNLRYNSLNFEYNLMTDIDNLKKFINPELFNELINAINNKSTQQKIVMEVNNVTKNILSQILPQTEIPHLTSDQTILETLTRTIITKNGNNVKLPSDVINNIFHKTQESINSYYKLRKNGRKFAKFPKFIKKGLKYGIKYYNGKGMYIKDNKIELFVGKHVNQNRNMYSKKKCIELKKNINHSQYAFFNDMSNNKSKNEKVFKYSENNKEYFINQSSELIFDGGYVSIDIPKNLFYEDENKNMVPKFNKITQLEIVPSYNNEFNIHISYEVKNKLPVIDIKNVIDPTIDGISIDLGLINLMTIYDPTGNQYIINGNKLKSINEYFNMKKAIAQSEVKIKNNRDTSKKINNLLKKRENLINNYFNQIVNKFFDMYKNKKIIIIGYNVNWKNAPKLGGNTKRNFMQIPFRKLINKIHCKGEEKGIKIVEINESYTSKCDALSLESVEKHKTYVGKRCKRGIFKSKKGRLLNADMNGAINIMRKYCTVNEINYGTVKGKQIFNPKIIYA